jgi:hypothetical protein
MSVIAAHGPATASGLRRSTGFEWHAPPQPAWPGTYSHVARFVSPHSTL